MRRYVLPFWDQEQGSRQHHNALLRLMAVNSDTNLVSRGGPNGLSYVQDYAVTLLNQPWTVDDLSEMDRQLIARQLSPGGVRICWPLPSYWQSIFPDWRYTLQNTLLVKDSAGKL